MNAPEIRFNDDRLARFSPIFEGDAVGLGLVGLDAETTLTDAEGLDILAENRSVGPQVKDITAGGMGGPLPFRDSLQQRLDLLHLKPEDLDVLHAVYAERAFSGVGSAVERIRELAAKVVVISGGFTRALMPFAVKLGFDPRDVHALTLGEDGQASEHLLLNPRGKRLVFDQLLQGLEGSSRQLHAMVGDGMTDAEVASDDTVFISVGDRSKVLERADISVPDISFVPEAIQALFARFGLTLQRDEAAK
jgi:HAD superfamily phosphoserine phosphatase-like hydrolase